MTHSVEILHFEHSSVLPSMEPLPPTALQLSLIRPIVSFRNSLPRRQMSVLRVDVAVPRRRLFPKVQEGCWENGGVEELCRTCGVR